MKKPNKKTVLITAVAAIPLLAAALVPVLIRAANAKKYVYGYTARP